ncbi:MAG TPA: PD-(D/E)XK nuclease family protein [Terriglobia bacterium]|nr:PD-(D/E)XK nuclease family protein [Terriglobia bacterium]
MDRTCCLIVSDSTQLLLEEALTFLRQEITVSGGLVVAPTRGAADDFLCRATASGISCAGVYRMTPAQMTSALAIPALAREELAPVSGLGQRALAARSAAQSKLTYFTPVVDTPGFAGALASTLIELRLNRIPHENLANQGDPGRDLAQCLARYENELRRQSLADGADIIRLATETAVKADHPFLGLPSIALSLATDSAWQRAFWGAVFSRAPAVLATALQWDQKAVGVIEDLLGVRAIPVGKGTGRNSLDRVRRGVFAPEPSLEPEPERDQSVAFFSAPGEGLECAEIARRILRAARSGVAFDHIAILLRHPDTYQPLVQAALRRAGVPAYFTHGTVRPDPSGRALLALLDCASEGLSASRFAEYLSLGQVPALDESGAPPERPQLWGSPADQAQAEFKFPEAVESSNEPEDEDTDAAPAVAGTLRTPFNWEKLLVDAAVIGGRGRWQERLGGLDAELQARLNEAERRQESTGYFERQLQWLDHLRRFAMPVIELLDSFGDQVLWGEWLERIRRLAGLTLRNPETVISPIAELEPMAEIGPVGLDEVRRALGERLRFLRQEPVGRRYGRVFVGTLDEAAARSFEVVFVPGVAEGLFPPRPSEDPLLLDDYRKALSPLLLTRSDQVESERVLLGQAVAAARSRLCVSYPRTEALDGRARVPSTFAIEILRASGGRLPPLAEIERHAAGAAEARPVWPSPREPNDAIDDTEYDLAFLEPLLTQRPEQTQGQAGYLLDANPHLARALRTRARRWRKLWTAADGLVDPNAATRKVLASHGLRDVTYSASALQQFAACPYRFLLSGIYRLRERKSAVALEQLDPLTRGSLFHEAQEAFLRELQQAHLLPVTEQLLPSALQAADRVFASVAARYQAEFAPALLPVWNSEIEALRTDFRGWVLQLPRIHSEWLPIHFEFDFGLAGKPQKGTEPGIGPALILDGVRLRGSIDLVERHRHRDSLRVTDYKTGRVPDELPVSVGRGEALQPLLYAAAAERLLGKPVEAGVLFYTTERGGYTEATIALNAIGRQRLQKVLDIIDDHIRQGFLPAAPRDEACALCDFRAVCGPHEEKRVKHKPRQRLESLNEVRCLP